VKTFLAKEVLIPLAVMLAEFIYKKWNIRANNRLKENLDKKKEALRKSIDEAQNDEQIQALSMLLRDLDEL